MKKAILESEVQRYISANENSNPNDLVLKGIPFEQELHAVILDQIKAKKKSGKNFQAGMVLRVFITHHPSIWSNHPQNKLLDTKQNL